MPFSGELWRGNRATRVRCNGGLGALVVCERKALRMLNGLHRKVDVQVGPKEVIFLGSLNIQDFGNGSIREPRELPEWYEEFTVSQEQPKPQR